MRWPSRADWSAHLAHWYDGEIRWEGRRVSEAGLFARILGVDARQEPPVIERGYQRRTCPHCGAVAVRPVDMPRDIHVFPPGHVPKRDGRGRIVGDVCPRLGEDPSAAAFDDLTADVAGNLDLEAGLRDVIDRKDTS